MKISLCLFQIMLFFATPAFAADVIKHDSSICDNVLDKCVFNQDETDYYMTKGEHVYFYVFYGKEISTDIYKVKYYEKDNTLWVYYKDGKVKLLGPPLKGELINRVHMYDKVHFIRTRNKESIQTNIFPLEIIEDNFDSTLAAGIAILGGALLWNLLSEDEEKEIKDCLDICVKQHSVCINYCSNRK